MQDKAGFKLIDKPRSLYYHDPGHQNEQAALTRTTASGDDHVSTAAPPGTDISLQLGDVGSGWAAKAKRGGTGSGGGGAAGNNNNNNNKVGQETIIYCIISAQDCKVGDQKRNIRGVKGKLGQELLK